MAQGRNGELLVQTLSFTLTYRLASVSRFVPNVLTAVTDVNFRAEILSFGTCVQFRTELSVFTGATFGTHRVFG
jgi:hypothetical protein